MSNRTELAAASKDLVLVPLNKLKKSPKNVRKTPHTKAEIQSLAASIAAIGMLQFPVIEPETGQRGKPTGFYLVNAGEGRRLAQLLRAKRKEIKTDEPIRCMLDTEHNATEISLAENAVRTDMHPADQYEAFAKLHTEEGMAAEDIAARFGVTATVVKQRLKLGAVSTKLMKIYRQGEMSLEQLSAFAITDDHDRQERVWRELAPFNRSRESILRALSDGQVRSTDRRALFVGAKAYEAAGGAIVRDLFDPEGGGFFADAELLDRLAREKLQAVAEKVAHEGWRWVAPAFEFDHGAVASMRRAFPEAVPLSKKERQQLRKLECRYNALCDKYPDGNMPDEVAAKLARIETAMQGLAKEAYRPREVKLAGAFVTLGQDGSLRIERGYIRAEDDPKSKRKPKANAKENGEGAPALSEKLVVELTAYRTSGLRNALAQHPGVALMALIHAFTLDLFFEQCEASCLEVAAKRAWLSGHAPGIDESAAEREIAERHQAWATRLPRDCEKLWPFIQDLSDAERLELLAHCVAQSVNAVRTHAIRTDDATAHADVLAREVALDMTAYWQPTAANYLSRVSKERIIEAVREGVSAQAAENIARLKKAAMAEAAETVLANTGWLPSLLRSQQTSQVAAEPLPIAAE
jgi:ParB family chromosome partitioning protein